MTNVAVWQHVKFKTVRSEKSERTAAMKSDNLSRKTTSNPAQTSSELFAVVTAFVATVERRKKYKTRAYA